MDIGNIMRAKQAWDSFCRAHPRFPDFLKAAQRKGITPDTDILISITYPDGENLKAGLKIKQSDLELLELLKNLKQ